MQASNGGGATKTTIMYKAVLSYDLKKDYLLSLAGYDIIEYEQGMKTYRTTPKGMHVLKLYNSVNEMVQPPVIQIENKKNDLVF